MRVGLLVRDREQSGPWHFVTRRGEELARNPRGSARLAAERRIGVALHERLERRIRRQFLIGECEPAAFAAMREVEIRARELAGAGNAPGDLGVKLVPREFGEGGSLADRQAEAGERQAAMALFWRAVGVFKNPSSHREVESTIQARPPKWCCSLISCSEFSTGSRPGPGPTTTEIPPPAMTAPARASRNEQAGRRLRS